MFLTEDKKARICLGRRTPVRIISVLSSRRAIGEVLAGAANSLFLFLRYSVVLIRYIVPLVNRNHSDCKKATSASRSLWLS